MKTVQVAIQNSAYAGSVHHLLAQDASRRVKLVARPDVTVGGVIVVDALNLHACPFLAKERDRLIVMVDKGRDDLAKIWKAGVRHVIFQGDPPDATRGVVLGVELSLGSSV
jgi:hypothetical protein